jgi:hypothetical protein
MYAITTTYCGPTNTRGSRIKVQSFGFKSKFYPIDYAEGIFGSRINAVDDYYATVMKQTEGSPLACGSLNYDTVVHCV